MFWADLVLFLLLAVVISSLLTWGLGWRHPAHQDALGASIAFLFLVLLVAMWAGAMWLPPWGPTFYGRPWVTPALIGLFVALLILAVATPPRQRSRSPREAVEADRATAYGALFGLFFWVLLVGLMFLAAIRYVA